MMRTSQILSVFIFFVVLPLSADTVLLRTGQTVEGTIVSQSRTDIRIQTATGIQVLQKANVQRVIYGSDAARLAEEKRILEERRLDELRKQEEAKKLEEARKQEEARKLAEQKRKAEEGKGKSTPDPVGTGPGRWSYAWRSMVLPGWGHLHGGENLTGYAYMGGFGLALIAVAKTQSAAQDAKSTYTSEVTMNKVKGIAVRNALGGTGGAAFVALLYMRQADAALQKDYQDAVQTNKRALGLLGTVYLAQLLHVTLFRPQGTAASEPIYPPVRIFAAALPGPDRSWSSVAGLSVSF